MKVDNACNIVAGSSLMRAIRNKHGNHWHEMEFLRAMVAHYAYMLADEENIDGILDEMEAAAGEISGDVMAA